MHRQWHAFIYASSAATYGGGDQGFVDDWSPAALATLKPMNLYAWSKHLFDRVVADRFVKKQSCRRTGWA